MTYTRYEPVVAGPLLDVTDLAAAVDAYMTAQPATRRWDVETSVDWAAADAGCAVMYASTAAARSVTSSRGPATTGSYLV